MDAENNQFPFLKYNVALFEQRKNMSVHSDISDN